MYICLSNKFCLLKYVGQRGKVSINSTALWLIADYIQEWGNPLNKVKLKFNIQHMIVHLLLKTRWTWFCWTGNLVIWKNWCFGQFYYSKICNLFFLSFLVRDKSKWLRGFILQKDQASVVERQKKKVLLPITKLWERRQWHFYNNFVRLT